MSSRTATKIYHMGILKPTLGFNFDMVLMNSIDVNQDFIRRLNGHCKHVVFCDGALPRYHHLFDKLEIEKHWIGDFDSSDPESNYRDVIGHKLTDQNSNDLEKALYLIESIRLGKVADEQHRQDCDDFNGNIIINGTTGGRFDHQM